MSQSVKITFTGIGASAFAQLAAREAAKQSVASGQARNGSRHAAFDRLELSRNVAGGAYNGSAREIASAALTDVAGLLGDVSGLLKDGSKLASGNSSNQGQIDAALAGVDRVALSAVHNGKALLQGGGQVVENDVPTQLPDIRTTSLGSTIIGGSTFTLRDLKGGGSLSNELSVSSSKVVATAIAQVQAVRRELLHGATASAGSAGDTSLGQPIGSLVEADKAGHEIRAALLASPTSASSSPDQAKVLALLFNK